MDNKTVMEKADITSSSISNGLMNPQQRTAFLNMVQEAGTLLKLARVVNMTTDKEEIVRFNIGGRVATRVAEDATVTARRGVGSDKITLDASDFMVPWSITDKALRNVVGTNFSNMVAQGMANAFKNDLEELSLLDNSDFDGDLFGGNDGFYSLAKSNGHVVDVAGAHITGTDLTDVFSQILIQMPQKFRKLNLVWFTSSNFEIAIRRALANKGGMALFSGNVIIKEGQINILGKPLVSVPSLPDMFIDGESVSGTADGTNKTFTTAYTAEEEIDGNGKYVLIVYVDGVKKTQGTDYTYDSSTKTITFATAPTSGATITATYLASDISSLADQRTFVMLIPRENLIYGISKNILTEKKRIPEALKTDYFLSTTVDFAFENPNAVALGTNVCPNFTVS